MDTRKYIKAFARPTSSSVQWYRRTERIGESKVTCLVGVLTKRHFFGLLEKRSVDGMVAFDVLLSATGELIEAMLPIVVSILLCFTSINLWRVYVASTSDRRSSLPLPPGSFGLPFLGETLHLAKNGYDFFRQKRGKYGRIYVTHLMGRPTIRVFGDKNIARILESDETLVTMHWPRSVQLLMGQGALGQSKSAVHDLRRSRLMNAFKPQIVTTYVPVLRKLAHHHIEKWLQDETVTCKDVSRRLALDMTARALLGVEFTYAQLTALLEALSVMEENFFSLPYNVPGFGLSKGMSARRFVLQELDTAIHQSMSQHRKGDDNHDALSVLLNAEEEDKLTVEEIKDSCVEMLFAGLEGISSAICTIIIQLAKNKCCYEKAVEEVHQFLAAAHNASQEDVGTLTPSYIKNIVKEALRVTPPVGGGYRKVLKTFELDGYQVPQGWTLLYSIRDQHETDPAVHNREAFDPDRWTAEGADNGAAYIPFGGCGPRSCVGQHFSVASLQAVTQELVSSCSWTLSNPSPKYSYFPTPYPIDGTQVRLSTK